MRLDIDYITCIFSLIVIIIALIIIIFRYKKYIKVIEKYEHHRRLFISMFVSTVLEKYQNEHQYDDEQMIHFINNINEETIERIKNNEEKKYESN